MTSNTREGNGAPDIIHVNMANESDLEDAILVMLRNTHITNPSDESRKSEANYQNILRQCPQCYLQFRFITSPIRTYYDHLPAVEFISNMSKTTRKIIIHFTYYRIGNFKRVLRGFRESDNMSKSHFEQELAKLHIEGHNEIAKLQAAVDGLNEARLNLSKTAIAKLDGVDILATQYKDCFEALEAIKLWFRDLILGESGTLE